MRALRHWRIYTAYPTDRRFQVRQCLLRDNRSDLGTRTSGLASLVRDEHTTSLSNTAENCLSVQRTQTPWIDHLDADPVDLRERRRFKGDMNHSAPRDDRDIVARTLDVGLTERNCHVPIRYLTLHRVKCLVFEEAHGVVIAYCTLQHAFRVRRRRGDSNIEAVSYTH